MVYLVELQEKTKVNKEEEVTLDSKLLLDEFNDVLPYEIIELPPVREIDYAIDFVTNATPTSRATHRFLSSK